jgi:carnosine N-methyltransferase
VTSSSSSPSVPSPNNKKSKSSQKKSKQSSSSAVSNHPPTSTSAPLDPELTEEQLEYSHWYDVMRTFLMYEDFMELDIHQRQLHLNRLSEQLANALPPTSFEKIDRLAQASKVNQRLFEEIVSFQDYGFAPRTRQSEPVEKFNGPRVHYSQMHRNQAVLHSLAREWSAYGAHERSQAFQPLLNALRKKLPVTSSNLYHQRVLVPGCGLARLPLEIASCGYACEANEYSMFMLTASHFVLNGISRASSIPIYPWIDRVSNVVHLSDVFEPLLVPDVSPVELMNSCPIIASDSHPEPDFMRFTMAAGNFVELYGGEAQAGMWDAIVTCFFLDTAPVVME